MCKKIKNQLMCLNKVEADRKAMAETIQSQREQLMNYINELLRI